MENASRQTDRRGRILTDSLKRYLTAFSLNPKDSPLNFDIPENIATYLDELDAFIEREILPLEQQDDNIRFFDHRREDARTDWERAGLPNEKWEALLAEARQRADAAGPIKRK